MVRYRQRVATLPYPRTCGIEYMSFDKRNWQVYGTYPLQMLSYMGNTSSADFCWDQTNGKPPYRVGGPFNLWHFADNRMSMPKRVTLISPYYTMWFKYEGCFQPGDHPSMADWITFPGNDYEAGRKNSTVTPDGNHTWGDAGPYGATGWNKFKPAKPGVDLGQFFGEAKDIPRMLQTTARGFRDLYISRFGRLPRGKTKKAADHWLNTQFGWKPFLSDLRSFYKTWKESDKLIAQLKRDNGQWIRRSGTVLKDETLDVLASSDTSHCSIPNIQGAHFNPVRGSHRITRVARRRVWFEAQFRYYMPKLDSVVWREKALLQLYGLDPNPALLWELTPWSWLVDWVSNVGDVLNNVSTDLSQNLAAKYAYVMSHREEVVRIESKQHFKQGDHTDTWERTLSRKHRVEANPFGFSLTWDGLSARQWSILGALGITRMH